jgi:hypothetical protein
VAVGVAVRAGVEVPDLRTVAVGVGEGSAEVTDGVAVGGAGDTLGIGSAGWALLPTSPAHQWCKVPVPGT